MRIKYLFPALIWVVVIFWVISMPPSSIPRTSLFQIPHFDKLVHYGVFFLFGIFLSYGFFKQTGTLVSKKHYTFSLLIGVIYGGATEWYQLNYVAGRSGEWLDFAANVAGCITGLLAFYWVKTYRPGFLK